VRNDEHGVFIEAFMPQDGHCEDCGSTNLLPGSDPAQFEKDLEAYSEKKDDLLAFYNELGLLVDLEPRKGYQDYEKIKRQIQYNIKH